MVFYDIVHFSEIEKTYGEETSKRILAALDQAIVQLPLTFDEVTYALRSFGDDYFVFLRLNAPSPADILPLAKRVGAAIERNLLSALERALPELKRPIAFHTSAVTLAPQGDEKHVDRLFYSAMKRALKLAKRLDRDVVEDEHRELLLDIIAQRAVTSVYQPIVSLADGKVIGYEALTRGPENGPLYHPQALFSLAEREGVLYTLERIARERAIECGAEFIPGRQKLFINVSPAVVYDPTFSAGHTLQSIRGHGLSARKIVFEVTEHQAIDDFVVFREVIEHYRRQGFLIAVDDAGAGYASFQTILALKPDFIKIDRALIAGIDRDPVKQSLLESFVHFALKINSKLIAEGVETPRELTQLIRLGVDLAQGYVFARPAYPPHDRLPKEASERILRHRRLIRLHAKEEVIEQITSPVHTVDARLPTSLVKQYFEETRDGGVVVVKDGAILGLIMRDKLFQVLATQYGASLYSRRPIAVICDVEPLIVEKNAAIDAVARLAMARTADKAYDYIIVADGDRLIGAVSVEGLLNYMANVKMEVVRLANPLTGLPGNHMIDLVTRQYLEEGRPFALLYVDLDRFKRYNDLYGYQRGDQVIQFVAETLQSAVMNLEGDHAFVGHIGGDDFIVLVDPEQARTVCEKIIAAFESGIGFYYKGLNVPEGERGTSAVAVSIAALSCEKTHGVTSDALSQHAALLKKHVKALPGSAYLIASFRHVDDESPDRNKIETGQS